ncbi:MAG TPA: substrate-binding domain-containing protein, partial [Pirellulales bacterium]|nr:substrate-binding domain-containing protein [Pirellulales bacterium]
MRRPFFALVIVSLALTVAVPGCSQDNAPIAGPKQAKPQAGRQNADAEQGGTGTVKEYSGNAVAAGERVSVAFVSNNPFEFWAIARRGTERAAKEFNADVEFHMPPNGTPSEQRQIIEDLLVKGVKGIAISPNDAANQASFLNEVAGQVPLITQDSDLPEGSKRLCYIGTNN